MMNPLSPDNHGQPVARLLLVEDDPVLAPLIVRHLVDSGFEVTWEATGDRAQWRTADVQADVVVLDVMLPGEDGLSLCRRIRQAHDVGIVMVTARGEEADRILGLELGADDYLPKPFSLWELEARIRAVLRRYQRRPAAMPAIRRFGALCVNVSHRLASMDNQPLELTRSEFDLLVRFTAEPGRAFTRDQLLEAVQGGETDAFDRAVDTHVSNLRRKIGDDPRAPKRLKTVWGIGYRFEPA
jgi:DNA-binding response OmpR family regulator